MASVKGTDGNDILDGTETFDTMSGGKGNDVLNGLGGNDQMRGDEGSDTLNGGDGDDDIYGDSGSENDTTVDVLNGDAGNDHLYGGIGDKFDGGSGKDIAYVNLKNVTVSVILDMNQPGAQPLTGGGSIVNIEMLDIYTGAMADRIKGGAELDKIHTGAGNDAIYGGGGEDFLYGEAGNDVIRGEAGADNAQGGAGHDRLIGGEGSDNMSGDQDTSGTGDGDDQLQGNAGNDVLYGNGGNDILAGGTDNDSLYGGAGADIFAFSGLNQGADSARDFSAAEGDRFDLDGKQFTNVVSDGNGGSLLTWEGGTIRVDKVVATLAEFNSWIVKGGNSMLRLTDAFDNILRYSPGGDTERAFIKDLNDKVVAGTLTEANAVKAIINLADASAAVATVSYAFFTGKTPGEGGMDYLLSPIGPNPNNLNSDYYKGFNAENRYINFAVNLGRDGDGKTAFAAEYGNKTLFEATRTAYAKIFGATPDDAKVHALIDSRVDYFKAYGQTDIGTKAAMVGWLLAEAMKADVGQFAGASNAYFTDMADGGPFNVDLIGQYGKPEYNL